MRTILKILIMLVGVFSYAQTTVSGSVTDKNDQPLSGATIIVVGTSNGVAADFDGNYSITVDMDAPFSIEASSVGFKAATVEVTGTSTVNIVLEDNTDLDEVVVSASRTLKEFSNHQLQLKASVQKTSEQLLLQIFMMV